MKDRSISVEPAIGSGLALVLFLLLIVLPGAAFLPARGTFQGSQDPQNPIRLNVDLVVLHATVQNRDHVLVSGLGKDDFQVYEDGVRQQIDSFSHEDIPVTVGLVIDNSGSMRPKRDEVIAAALAFARSSNPEDQIFVVNFNEKVSFGLPGGTPFADKSVPLAVALSKIATNGMTALYDGVAAGLEHLKMGNRDKKVLIVISDGGDNASRHKLAEVMTMAVQAEAIIYTLGIFDESDEDRNPRVLKQIAKTTGGEAFLPESLKEIVPICERIARDIRNQYTLAYISTNLKQDGNYRTIQVKAGGGGRGNLSVRTRAGYRAPLAP